jgi:hypothetical protein
MKKSVGWLLAATAAASTVVIPGTAAAVEEQVPTQPVHATEDNLDPGRLYSAPDMAVDPNNPLNVVAGFSDLRSRRCGVMRSADGGATWTELDSSPSLPGYPFCAVPAGSSIQTHLAFGREGTLYYAMTGWATEDGGLRTGNVSVLLGRSDDLGDTWQTSLVDDTRGLSGEETQGVRPMSDLVVDTETGSEDIVYVGWSKSFTGTTAPNQRAGQPAVAVSTDGGRTFAPWKSLADGVFTDEIRAEAIASAPEPEPGDAPPRAPAAGSLAAEPEQPANFGGISPTLAVDSEGNLVSVWGSTSSNITPRPQTGQFVSTSSDQGQTWTTTQLAPFQEGNASRLRVAWSPDGAAQGSFHIVAQGNPLPDVDSHGEIFHRRSTDGGRSWSEQVPLTDDDPELLRGQYQPTISTAPNGRIDVTWWDTRDDPGIRGNDVYYTFSNDGGETWSSNQRITDRTVDRRVGVWAFNFDISSPPGMASTDAYALFGWDDTRDTPPDLVLDGPSAPGFGTQDIYTAAVQHSVVPVANSNLAKILLAGMIGLIAVGLLLLGITLGRRKGPKTPTPTPTKTDKTTAKVG